MNVDESIIAYAVYEDSVEYSGTAKVALPDITYLTQGFTGVGVAGNMEAVIAGYIDVMKMTLEFRTMNENSIALSEPRLHKISLLASVQIEDTSSGTIAFQSHKHVMVGIPTKYSGGSLAPASIGTPTVEFAVRYWAFYIDGVRMREIDPFNHIHFVNGRDYLADVRKALGK
ncbi:MAG: Phage tail tube protein [Eubacterium sp.]|jgi:P2 family phage contractile tail tube protein|nr:Phage tail tube protein [Eubacterium sp.]